MKPTRIPLACMLLMMLSTAACSAQALVVHTVDSRNGKPLAHIPVTIRYNFLEPRKARKDEVITVTSDQDGEAIFPSLLLSAGGFSVSVWSTSVCPEGLEPAFFPLGGAPPKFHNPIYTSLPAEITLRARRRTFAERLHMIFPGP